MEQKVSLSLEISKEEIEAAQVAKEEVIQGKPSSKTEWNEKG